MIPSNAAGSPKVQLDLGHIKAGAIIHLHGMPFRLKAAVEVESHPENFNAVLDDENLSGSISRLAIGAVPAAKQGEPYGYVWFNKHMEQRFTRKPPHPESSEQPVDEPVAVYRAEDGA